MSWLFVSGGQSIGASASVFAMNIQGWCPLGLTGLISLQSKGLSRVFSTIWKASILQHTAFFKIPQIHPFVNLNFPSFISNSFLHIPSPVQMGSVWLQVWYSRVSIQGLLLLALKPVHSSSVIPPFPLFFLQPLCLSLENFRNPLKERIHFIIVFIISIMLNNCCCCWHCC